MMPTPPRLILVAVLLLSGAALLTTIGGVWVSVSARNWFILGFEVVAMVGAVCGVLTGAGRFREGPALSTLCTGLILIVGALLSEPTLVSRVVQGGGGVARPVAGVDLVPWAAGRVLAGGALVGLAGLMVLLRRPARSFSYLVRGVLLGAPVGAAMVAMILPSTRSMIANAPGPALIALVIGGFLIAGTLISLSAHHLIRAFEVGIEGIAPGTIASGNTPPITPRPVTPPVAPAGPKNGPGAAPGAPKKGAAPRS